MQNLEKDNIMVVIAPTAAVIAANAAVITSCSTFHMPLNVIGYSVCAALAALFVIGVFLIYRK